MATASLCKTTAFTGKAVRSAQTVRPKVGVDLKHSLAIKLHIEAMYYIEEGWPPMVAKSLQTWASHCVHSPTPAGCARHCCGCCHRAPPLVPR